MGKRIEDLPVDDTPLAAGGRAGDRAGRAGGRVRLPEELDDARDHPWYAFIGVIDDLLATGEYDWASDSLTGIRETVERSRRVTQGQRVAVERIEASRGRGGSRRYEGYQRARW